MYPASNQSKPIRFTARRRQMTIETILIWMLCGLIAGAVARLFLPGPQNIGLIMTMILGVVGAFVGSFLYSLVREPLGDPLAFAGPWEGWIVAILGAMLVIGIYVGFSRRRRAYYY
jgi:uncharacterized membrane protein YeaQ/YmgE (transglycosylase-associated protein family)